MLVDFIQIHVSQHVPVGFALSLLKQIFGENIHCQWMGVASTSDRGHAVFTINELGVNTRMKPFTHDYYQWDISILFAGNIFSSSVPNMVQMDGKNLFKK
ncbi:hypothetical protein JTE90_001072 [Oedothorax gibbosus]|uniref:Uncharacterized protein n=1 Tax=Oedothorax gibbosus TaxID=931172 RepID=A0AAV6TNA3_9ARAC|nr:hypothetical protein JTE90_001072 [Oedothorax gibbosus]